MNNDTIINELEKLYRGFLEVGNHVKAQEVLFKIAELKRQDESEKSPNQNILLG